MIAYVGGGLIGAGTVSGLTAALPAIVIVAAIALGFTLLAIAVQLLERAGRVQAARDRILANERAGELEPAPLGHRRIGLDRPRRTR